MNSTITIIGKDASGKVVAEEKTDDAQKAKQIANYWRGSGLDVTIHEQDRIATAQDAPVSTNRVSDG